MTQSRPNFLLKNGRIFSSALSQPVPPVPDAHLLSGERPSPHLLKRPCWANNRFPALAFVPTSPRFDSPPLDILRLPREGRFRIVKDQLGWIVEPRLAQDWTHLEKNLRFIA